MSKSNFEEIFGEGGILSKKINHFHPRWQQLKMAQAVDDTISSRDWLVAEAATGTGKTFAYLVPALFSSKKMLIATATKTLQDQLVNQDLPKILKALGLSRSVQNLKGRDNYLCKYHITRILTESSASTYPFYNDLVYVYQQLPHLEIGEKSEIRHISQDAIFWNGLTAHTENCLASKCPIQSECFMYQARQKAMAADCVVVNHHLFFADSRLKADGFGALLPAFEVFIFDEAHQLLDVATQYYSQSFSTAQILRLVTELKQAVHLHDEILQKKIIELEQSVEAFLETNDGAYEAQVIKGLIRSGALPLPQWLEVLQDLLNHTQQIELPQALLAIRWVDRIKELILTISHCVDADPSGTSWMKPLKRHVRFQWSPFDVGTSVETLLKQLQASLIFASATLRTNQQFNWFTSALGLQQAKCLSWDSPYDWQKQALLYVPHGLPDIHDIHYYQVFMEKIIPVIEKLGGKTFVLFTSHKALQWVASQLPNHIDFPILVQGTDDKSILLENFRRLGNAVLLGTGSFWEGVDVQGEALSCVAIDKLPFMNISEPLVSGKLAYLKAQGKQAFEEYLIPQAILTLKQGVGRLLRTEKDHGVLIIGDPRLIGRPYGAYFKSSLPPMTWTRSLPRVNDFIDSFKKVPQLLSKEEMETV